MNIQKIKIVVVDDHAILRESLVNVLSNEDNIEVVGDWSNGEELIDFMNSNSFDLAILDNKLPGISGVKLSGYILKNNKKAKIIILSMYCEAMEILRALRIGVRGYLPKESSVNELTTAIRAVFEGSVVLGSGIIKGLLRFHRGVIVNDSMKVKLTEEEKTILFFTSNGFANKEIAQKMELSLSLVKYRFREILNKLEARDRTHAVVKSIKMGLI